MFLFVFSLTAGESNEPSVDGISTSDNLLDIGPQITTVENGFGANWWNIPAPPMTQPPHGNNIDINTMESQ